MIPKSAKKFFNKAALTTILAFSMLTGLAAGGNQKNADNPLSAPSSVTEADKDIRQVKKDAIFSDLLKEATEPAGYWVQHQEKQNADLSEVLAGKTDNRSYRANKTAFDAAYKTAWEKHAKADPYERETRALEAGGQAVVRSLLEGRNPPWTRDYIEENLSSIEDSFCDAPEASQPQYNEVRRAAFVELGKSDLDDINIVPPELLDGAADKYINTYLEKQGLTEAKFAAMEKKCTEIAAAAEEEKKVREEFISRNAPEEKTVTMPGTPQADNSGPEATNESVEEPAAVTEPSSYLPYAIPVGVILGAGGIVFGGAAYGRHRARKRLSSYRR